MAKGMYERKAKNGTELITSDHIRYQVDGTESKSAWGKGRGDSLGSWQKRR
jgi:hypothetical protein